MALDAVIFDVDGTLVDTTALHARSWAQAFEACGFSVPAARVSVEIGKGGHRLMTAILGQDVARARGDEIDQRRREIFLEAVQREGVRLLPAARETLESIRARGLKTAIATAADREVLETIVEQAGVDLIGLADEVVTDDDTSRSKPRPEAVQPAAAKLGLSPAQCVMIGDTPYDAEASKQAGLVCFAVQTGGFGYDALHRAGARAVYRDLGDLLERLDDALTLASPMEIRLTQERLETLMQAALEEARTGMAAGELPIGSVLVGGNGEVLARGHNEAQRLGSLLAHAELQALQHAAGQERDETEGLTLVTTLEPCVMCLGAAMNARVDTVVYGLPAPSNGGVTRVQPYDNPDAIWPRLVGGVLAEESRRLLTEWLDQNPESAFVRNLLTQLKATRVE